MTTAAIAFVVALTSGTFQVRKDAIKPLPGREDSPESVPIVFIVRGFKWI